MSKELVEALELIIDRFGPCEKDYIFSKRMALQKARAALAAYKPAQIDGIVERLRGTGLQAGFDGAAEILRLRDELKAAPKPEPVVPEGWKPVPIAELLKALELTQNEIQSAYNNAIQVCCDDGSGSGECCGNTDPEWSKEDIRIMDALSPVHRLLSGILAAAPQEVKS